jgi:hypothetical protein
LVWLVFVLLLFLIPFLGGKHCCLLTDGRGLEDSRVKISQVWWERPAKAITQTACVNWEFL